MTQKEKKDLIKQAKQLIATADREDALVECNDGVETNNIYPVWMAYGVSPDTKSVTDWINGISFHHTFRGLKCNVSLTLKKGAGKVTF